MSGTSIFTKYIAPEKEQPEPVIPSSGLNPTLTKLLLWLINHWPDATISARDLVTYIWHIQTSEEAITLAESLVKKGFLIPLPAHRYDRRVRRICGDRFEHMGQPACDIRGEVAVVCLSRGRQVAKQDDADRVQMVENRQGGTMSRLSRTANLHTMRDLGGGRGSYGRKP